MNAIKNICILFLSLLILQTTALGEPRFPPPDFESGYEMPPTYHPALSYAEWEWIDSAVLILCLVLASWISLKSRSRRQIIYLSVFSLAYFGFFRTGCICAIGSVQNVGHSLSFEGYKLPLTAAVFFFAPLLTTLFAGRSFCSAVCPHGVLQDLLLVKAHKLPIWLEKMLGLIPFIYLGTALLFVFTAGSYLICRLDPFVGFFRMQISGGVIAFGLAFLLISTVVGRPYCRFLCPYGALLGLAGSVSKWRVTITPNTCTGCHLCVPACPFDAIEPPAPPINDDQARQARTRFLWWLGIAPVVVLIFIWAGKLASPALASLDSTVHLVERYMEAKEAGNIQELKKEDQALERASREESVLLEEAARIRDRFKTAGPWFGAWLGLVFAGGGLPLLIRRSHIDFEPDRSGCFSCARCFTWCPNERTRLGLSPSVESVNGSSSPHVQPQPSHHG